MHKSQNYYKTSNDLAIGANNPFHIDQLNTMEIESPKASSKPNIFAEFGSRARAWSEDIQEQVGGAVAAYPYLHMLPGKPKEGGLPARARAMSEEERREKELDDIADEWHSTFFAW